MPVFAADLLPDATGRNLGNPSQRWNANLQSLNVLGAMSLQPVSGQAITPGGAIYVQTAPATANANSTAGQGLITYTVLAGLLNAPGKVLRGTMGGSYTTQSGQTPALSIVVFLGPVQVFQVTTDPLSAAQPNNTWRAQWEVVVYAPGSSAQVDVHGTMVYQLSNSGNGGKPLIDARYTALGPIDLTVAQQLVSSCLFTTNTSPANVCIQREFLVEVLN